MRAALPFLLTGLLVGCASPRPTPAPVTDRTQAPRPAEEDTREVRAGDTLFSIAWEAGRDYRELAVWNDIAPPYTIRPGQKLRLSPPAAPDPDKPGKPAGEPPVKAEKSAKSSRPAASEKTRSVIHTVVRGETLTSIARKYGVEPRQIAAWNNLSPPYRLSRGQKLRLAPASAKRPPAVSGTPSVKPPARPGGSGKAIWSWPAQGALLERYKPNAAMKGIDIGGKKGQPVHAAGEGQVVYQGSGLRGYGQLIILKHDADYLSAYAHCDRILVKEGDMIKRGQKIAEMGASGTDRVKLHFEIRYRGAPVDPLSHLPRR